MSTLSLNLDLNYPGIEIKVEFLVLHEYLSQIMVGINAACQAYLEQEIKKHEDSEYYEYQHIYSVAEEEIPRVILLPMIVSIYTLFDNSMTRLMAYAQQKEGKGLSIKDINGKSPSVTYNKYMKYVLGYEFQISEKDMEKLSAIGKIRNCVAHTSGVISALSEENINNLCKIKINGFSIDRTLKQVNVTNEFNLNALKIIQDVIQNLMQYMEHRYGLNYYA